MGNRGCLKLYFFFFLGGGGGGGMVILVFSIFDLPIPLLFFSRFLLSAELNVHSLLEI